MFKTKGRILALVMTIMMVVGSLPVIVLAYGYDAEPEEDAGYLYDGGYVDDELDYEVALEEFKYESDAEYVDDEMFFTRLGGEFDMYAPGGITDPAGPPVPDMFDPLAAPTSIPPAIPLPNRWITPEELAAWTENYHDRGGINEFELEVLRLVNIERTREGLQPVVLSPILSVAARFKSQGMANRGYFGHESPIYGHFTVISRELFNVPIMAMGENLGRFQRTPEVVVNAWMNSPGHRGNIMNPRFTDLGVGFYAYHWTQKFTDGSTLHIPVPTPAPPEGTIVDSWEALRAAVNAAPVDQPYTIHIGSSFSATGNAITIPAGRDITLTSTRQGLSVYNVRTLTQARSGQRHFIVGVNSSLTLCRNIQLHGGMRAGGVQVNGGGEFVMNYGSTISDIRDHASIVLLGSGTNVTTQARMKMYGGVIIDNRAHTTGVVEIGINSILVMKNNSEISNNEAVSTFTTSNTGSVVLLSETSIVEMHDTSAIRNNIEASFLASGDPGRRAGGVLMINGFFTMYGGSIANNDSLSHGSHSTGGVHIMNGTFIMHDGSITGNEHGGLRMVSVNANLIMNGGEISNNGRGRFNGSGVHGGTFVMNDGLIYNNRWHGVSLSNFTMNGGSISNNDGSGVSDGVFTMNGGTIDRNNQSGVDIGGGLFTMTDGTISNNSHPQEGGGIRAWHRGAVHITGGTITGNTARRGGGVFINSGNVENMFTMTGGSITNNHAIEDGGGIFTPSRVLTPSVLVTAYSNLNIGSAVVFSGNTADRGLSAPPVNYYVLTHIASRNASRWGHPLNNYDISYLGRMGEEHGVSSWEALRQAVNNSSPNIPTTIYILTSFYAPAPAVGNAIIIPANRQITLVSSNPAAGAANVRVLDQFNDSQRHFVVNGSLTLGRNITLRTGSNSGGVQVSGGSFNMGDGSAIIGG